MQTITAFYDSLADAQRAAETLRGGGFNDDVVRIVDQSAQPSASDAAVRERTEDRGFFGSLRDMFVPDEDSYVYEEGIRRGGALLTVRVEEGADADRAIDLLDSTGAVDIDTRASEWRSAGWSGYDASAATGTAFTSGEQRRSGSRSPGRVPDLVERRLAGERRQYAA